MDFFMGPPLFHVCFYPPKIKKFGATDIAGSQESHFIGQNLILEKLDEQKRGLKLSSWCTFVQGDKFDMNPVKSTKASIE